MTETLLIVEPDAVSQRSMVDALKAGRYRTLTAESFASAVQLIELARPELLITVVRLGRFNGLHLVVLGRASDPRMAALVIDDRRDAVLEREARDAGATAYMAKPVSSADLLRCVAQALASRERRCWSRTPLASTVLVGIAAGQARLLDVSYGGFRLESGTVHQHDALKLELPILGLSVQAERVWSRRTHLAAVWSCGAALVAPTDSEGTQRWRRLVDTVRAGAALSLSRPRF
jgi:DNA-binding response OmpR family regulator